MRSSRTATSRIAPVRICCQYDAMPATDNPFCSVAKKRTPTAVPPTPPMPPAKLVPPSSTAAAASKSTASPTCGLAAPIRAVCSTPATPASRPEIAYTATIVRFTLMPESRAASAFPPTAYTSRPKYVDRCTKSATANVSTISHTGYGTPRNESNASESRNDESTEADARQREHRADREVEAAGEHHEGQPDRNHPEDCRACQQHLDVRGRREAFLGEGEEHEEPDEEDEHGEEALAGDAAQHRCPAPSRAQEPCPIAKRAIAASSASSRRSRATIRPRYMTRIRSQSSCSSGISEELTSIPTPRFLTASRS